MNRSYVRDSVEKGLLKHEIVLTRNEVNSIVDSILFDWNELGDPKADFEEMVSWNIDQYLSHNHDSKKELKRITRNEARKMKLERYIQSDYPAYSSESPRFFSMTDSNKDGWQSVEYWK